MCHQQSQRKNLIRKCVIFLKSSILALFWKSNIIHVYFFKLHWNFIHVKNSRFKWLFTGYITWGTENWLFMKCNIKNPNYDDDQNCLHKNVTKFPNFTHTNFDLHFKWWKLVYLHFFVYFPCNYVCLPLMKLYVITRKFT